MKARELMLRCMARRDGPVWVAMCLDFDLVAQGDSFEEAREKLSEQVTFYVRDVLAGDDREHADYLLSRRAPLRYFAIWHGLRALSRLDHMWRGAKTFVAPIPMEPKSHCHA